MISLVMCAYNEWDLAVRGLKVIKDFVDEIIIVDGSPEGVSSIDTDKRDEIKSWEKVKYFAGTFAKPDGSWDEATQKNFAISQATQQYIMFHDCDIMYDIEELEMLEKAIVDHPERKVFYTTLLEYWMNQDNIRVYPCDSATYSMPTTFRAVIAADMKPSFNGMSVVCKDADKFKTYMYVPQCTSYHYGWIKGFQAQLDKHLRNLRMGLWGAAWADIEASKDKEQVKWALGLIKNYPSEICRMPYSGNVPLCMEGLSMSYMDGYEKAMDALVMLYGEDVKI